MIGPIVLFAHADTDEDAAHYFTARQKAAWTSEQILKAEAFLRTNPLFEVQFRFYLNEITGESYLTEVDLGYGEPWARAPGPGEQLVLFDQEQA